MEKRLLYLTILKLFCYVYTFMNNRIFLLHPATRAASEMFPLGLAILSAILRQNGYEVRVIDAAAPLKRLNDQQVLQMIKEFDPLFVGITLTIDFVSEKYKFINEIKGLKVPIVAGGPHVNYMPEEVLTYSNADIVSIGEGENAIIEICEYFQEKRNLESISGIGYKKDNSVHLTQKRALIEDLDSIPYPDYDDFQIRNYTGSDDPASDRMFWRIMSSRGCPYTCLFCTSNQVFGRKYRLSSARRMFDEMYYLHERYGAPTIALQDNEPLIDKNRISTLCDLLMSNKLNH